MNVTGRCFYPGVKSATRGTAQENQPPVGIPLLYVKINETQSPLAGFSEHATTSHGLRGDMSVT